MTQPPFSILTSFSFHIQSLSQTLLWFAGEDNFGIFLLCLIFLFSHLCLKDFLGNFFFEEYIVKKQ